MTFTSSRGMHQCHCAAVCFLKRDAPVPLCSCCLICNYSTGWLHFVEQVNVILSYIIDVVVKLTNKHTSQEELKFNVTVYHTHLSDDMPRDNRSFSSFVSSLLPGRELPSSLLTLLKITDYENCGYQG